MSEWETWGTLLRSRHQFTVANRPTQRPVHPRPVVGEEVGCGEVCFWRICFMSNCSLSSLNPTRPWLACRSRSASSFRRLLAPRPHGRGTLWHCCNVWELPFGPPSLHCPPPSFIFPSSASLPQGKAKLRPLPPCMSPIEFFLAAAASAAHEKYVVAAHQHMAISCRILHFPFSAKWRSTGRGGGDLSVDNG